MTADADILDSPEAGPAAIRGAALRVVGYLVSIVMSVGSAAVLLRYLGVDEYGKYATIFSLMTIVGGVTEAGAGNIGVRELSVRPKSEHRLVIANLQGMRLVLTTVGCAIALLFAFGAGYSEAMMEGAALASVGLVLTVLGLTLWVPPQAELRLGVVTVLDLIRQAATVIALLTIAVVGGGIALLLGAQIPVAIAVVISSAIAVHSARALIPAFDLQEWRRLFADSIPYAAAVGVGVIYSQITIVVMSLVSNDTETGLFGAAFRIFFVIAAIPSLIAASAFPVLARAGRDDLERLRYGIQRLFDMFLVLAAGAALVTAAGAPVAIDIVAGREFADAVPVLQIQALALVATFGLALGSFALLSLRLHAALVIGNALGLLVSTGLTLVLAPGLGAEGGALANLAGEIVLAGVYLSALRRKAGIVPHPHNLPRVLAALALGAAAAFLLPLPALPATLLGAAVFVGAAFVLRAVPREAIEAFTALRPGARAATSTPPPSQTS